MQALFLTVFVHSEDSKLFLESNAAIKVARATGWNKLQECKILGHTLKQLGFTLVQGVVLKILR